MTAADPQDTMPSGVSAGWISNFNYRNLSPHIKKNYAIAQELLTCPDTFKTWAPLYALATDLSAIFGVTPMSIEMFIKQCTTQLENFYPYLIGQKRLPNNLPPLVINQARRNHLKSLNIKNKQHIKTLWPSLRFCCCWMRIIAYREH